MKKLLLLSLLSLGFIGSGYSETFYVSDPLNNGVDPLNNGLDFDPYNNGYDPDPMNNGVDILNNSEFKIITNSNGSNNYKPITNNRGSNSEGVTWGNYVRTMYESNNVLTDTSNTSNSNQASPELIKEAQDALLKLMLSRDYDSFEDSRDWVSIGSTPIGYLYMDINPDNIIANNKGEVYFTSVVNLNESRVGLLSERMDVLIDCETYIFKALNIWSHKEKLGRGISYKGTNVSDDWLQAPENSPLERMSKKACEIYIKDVLKLPENAHLSGNSWKCDDKFYKSNNECIELPPFSYSSPSGFVCMDDWEKDDSEGCKPAGIKRNWKKMSEKKTFDSYIDDKNIYQQDNGEVLFWYLADWSEPDLDGNISRLLLARTNCKTNQMLAIYETIYKQHMAEGGVSGRIWHTEFDSDIGQYINLKWRLIKPKTAMEVLSSYACENANRKVKEEVIEEEDLSSALMIEDQLNILKSAYINNIAAEVRSNWRYPGADDDWSCNVIVLQNENGKVLNVNIQDCNTGSSDNALMTDDKVRAFMNSIERAVYKASPLPMAPDKAVFDREILLKFRVN